jgi:hypothetical protein
MEDAKDNNDFDFVSSFEGDHGDGADSLEFSAFDRRHSIRIFYFIV